MPREGDDPAEVIKASHEVMGLVRGNSVLSHLVLQLRDRGLLWREVRAALQAEIDRRSRSPQPGDD